MTLPVWEAPTHRSLVRKMIAARQIALTISPPEALPVRRRVVMATIYLMFNEGYYSGGSGSLQRKAVCIEAITLARA